ncbi:efflux RND transporter periplasmic adaptor subunit [Pseudomonas sp. RIT-PI-S]|uniref:efflux RND transporter periplasmic adaptor subunit n=1 Tax=Pseudomonas sp. RIT-PI-S TaxID=3035295 RepID=UPI0021DA096A|nr:efflux RND transporter periplasmic adaptor subunit [Pseudomonas sp. RIT-PI-S]
MKRWFALPLVLLAGCSDDAPPPEPIRPVLSATVVAVDQQELGRFAGNIEPRYQSTLGFRVSGRIARRLVDVGDEVKQGDLLAVLDPTDQQNQLRSREGDLSRVEAQWINAQANSRRQQELFDRGVGSAAQLDRATADLKTSRASLEQAKAAASQARDQLDYSELRADHDAIVTALSAEAGQVVAAGQEVVTLARPDVKEAVIDLPASLVEELAPGLDFYVQAQLDPTAATHATLREIEPQANSATRTRQVRLSLANTPPGLRLGTAISVAVSRRVELRGELPLRALQDAEGQTRVWVIDEQAHTVAPRPVKVLERKSETAIVDASVHPGERVVVAGLNSLKPGQQIKNDQGKGQ